MQNISITSFIKRNNFHRPLVFNSVLWFLVFVILLFVVSKGKQPIGLDYIYTLGLVLVMAIPVNINFYVLIPRFLNTEKYVSYGLGFLINLTVLASVGSLLYKPVLDAIFPNYFFVSYPNQYSIILIFTIVLVATTLLKLAEDWFYFNRNQNQILKLQNQHIKTQLSALRSQINPHFLFNSLNVIYALALDKKEDITSAIVQLSDILRYVIYDTDIKRVALKDEVQLLKNYIAFQQHRGNNAGLIDLQTTIERHDFQIYPMLLLPLLENACKYGLPTAENSNKIKIQLNQNGSEFRFTIENPKAKKDLGLDNNYSGTGIKTLQENLNLVYPKQHTFLVSDTETHFKVQLQITDEQN